MTKTEIAKIENAVEATLKIEGLKASEIGKGITHKYLNNEIDSKTAIQLIKNLYI